MRAFVMKGIGKVGFADKPIPTPGPTDAIVKTTKALICTSDVHTVNGAIGPRDNLTLGHEAVGRVHQVGAAVKRFKPGDHVLVGAITPEWGDAASQAGHSSQSGGALGGWKFANIKDGVFAEYFHVNEADANMAHIPAAVADDSAVYCCDMISTGLMAAENANIPPGGTVAVFALGPVGLMAVAGARMLGAGLIIGVDSVPRRQELARSYGADVTVDFEKQDAVARIMDLTGGEGVDSAIEALGGDLSFQNAIRVTKPGWHHLQRRLSWQGRVRAHPADGMGCGDGGEDDSHGAMPGRAAADGAAVAPAPGRPGRPDAPYHAHLSLRRVGTGVRDDGAQARRDHQAADPVLVPGPAAAMGRIGSHFRTLAVSRTRQPVSFMQSRLIDA